MVRIGSTIMIGVHVITMLVMYSSSLFSTGFMLEFTFITF